MAVQTNNLLLRPTVAPYVPRSLDPDVDELALSVDIELLNGHSMTIDGNLTVRGTTTTVESETVKVADNHMYLNDGYTTASAETGGLVVNYLPIATSDTVNGAFVAGVPATSNPTVVTTGSGTFAVGQFIQISGAADEANNGIFEVLSHTGTLLTIRGVGLTATVEDFTQNDFVADATVQGTITRVTLSIIRAGTDGAWETASGATTGLTFDDLVTTATAATTLQEAYEGGNTITTSAAEGNVIVQGDQAFQIGGTVLLDVNTTADFDVSQFDVDVTGAGYSLDADTASNISTTSANLTLSTITAGTLFVTSAGLLDIDAAANIDIDVTGTFDVLATGALSLDATGASNLTIDSGNLTLSTTTSGNVIVSAVDDLDVDADAITIDALEGVSIDAALSSNLSMNANNAGAQTLTIDATNAGAGAGNLDVNVDDALTVDAGSFSVDATGASNVSVTGAELSISTLTSGELDITAAGLLDVNAAASMDIDVTGTFDVLATGAFSIDGTGASNLSATSGNLTLSTITSGSLLLTSAGDSTYTVPNGSATALQVTDGTDTYIIVDSVDDELELPQFVNISGVAGAGVQLVANAAIAVGEIVQIISDGGGANTGRVNLADADTGLLTDANVVGVAVSAAGGAGTAIQVATVPGTLIPILFGAAPAASANGDAVYLSATAGQATLTAPTGNDEVTFRVGYLQGADGADTTPLVLYQPQFLSAGPQVS